MCSAQSHLLEGLGVRDAPRRRAVARARPVNSEGRHDRSANDVRAGQGADGAGARASRPPSGPPRHRAAGAPPDDRLTAVLPALRDNTPAHLRDPIDVVKAALDGVPPPKPPPVPSRQWVQVATGRSTSALAFDWRRIKKEGGALLARQSPSTAKWGQTNRLLIGPFASDDAADAMVKKLKDKKMDAFRFTSDVGEDVKPLPGG